MRSGSFLIRPVVIAGVVAALLGNVPADAQSRNNPYSPSPGKRPSSPQGSRQATPDDGVSFRLTSETASEKPLQEPVTIAHAAYKVDKPAAPKSLSPTETYKIGVGDVLYVRLKNAPNGSGYFTVRGDGTIDYPLAGERVVVGDQPLDLAAENIAGGIRLFASPEVEVKIREYGSHKITVTGSVENAGEKSLKREAMPLFAIRAEAVPNAKATKVRIKRAGASAEEVLDLLAPKSDEALIFPGDQVHFFGDAAGSYFISGEVVSAGQKDLVTGLTLYQAIIASGGAKGDPKKALIRRKNDKGMLAVTEYKLRSIKDGKTVDPLLAAGDIVEIRN